MLYIYVIFYLLIGIMVAEATQRLVTTFQSLGGLGHHGTGYYSEFQGIFFQDVPFPNNVTHCFVVVF